MNKRNRSITEGLSIHILMGGAGQTDVTQASPASSFSTTSIPHEKNSIKGNTDEKPKLPHPEKTEHNAKLIRQGEEILATMSKEEIQFLGSKSGTLHFVHLLGLASKKSNRSIGGVNNRTYKDISTPVGVTLRSDIDIEVPVIDVLKNKDTGIDPEKDISYREVKAGEEFDLTYYEFMFLILRDEYAGFFEANGDDKGAHLSVKSPAFMRGDAKLPTPYIDFRRNNRIKYEGQNENPPIKSTIIDIDQKGPNGWEIKPQYAEKFGALLNQSKRKK